MIFLAWVDVSNMDMSNIVENKKPPLPKGRGTTEGGGGIKKGFVKRIPQSATLTAPFRQGGL